MQFRLEGPPGTPRSSRSACSPAPPLSRIQTTLFHCLLICLRLRGMFLDHESYNVTAHFRPSPPAVSPSGIKSSGADQATILCKFATKPPRQSAQTPPKARSRRDLAIPPLNSFLREGLAQPPLSSTTFHDPETLSDVEPAGTSVPRNFVQIFSRRLGAEEFSFGP